MLPAVLLAMWASANVNSTFRRYSTQYSRRGITGAQAARRVLDANGLTAVRIEHISGNLTDHYDPKANVIRLSDQVYDNTSTAAIGVACHRPDMRCSTPWVTPPSGFAPPLSHYQHRLQAVYAADSQLGLLFSVYSPQMYYLVYAGICLWPGSVQLTLPTGSMPASRAWPP